MTRRRRFATAHLAILSAASFLFLVSEAKKISMNDLGIYLAQGQEMVRLGRFVDVDHFTHTVAGHAFLNGTWLAQLLFYALWRIGGYATLQLVLAAAVTGAVLITTAGARRAGGTVEAAGLGGLLAAWLVVQNLGLRPQLFSLPLFAAYAAIAMTVRPRAWTMAASAAIVALWVNLHGAFAVAPSLSLALAAGAFWESLPAGTRVAEIPRHLLRALREPSETRGHLLTAAVVLVAACANPYGPAIFGYLAKNTASPAERGLQEWKRTGITDPAGIRLAVATIAFAVLAWRKKRLPARRDLPAVLAFGGLALSAIRHVLWTGMVWPIALARLLTADGTAAASPRRVPAWLAAALALFWGAGIVGEAPMLRVRGLSGDDELAARFDDWTPVRLAAWCGDHGVSGNVFNPMEWGSLLAWRDPAAKLFVDIRIWIFPDDVWAEYLDVSHAKPGWEETLDRRHCAWAILDRRFHAALIPAMEKSDRWEKVYEDADGLVFRRRPLLPP